MRYLILRPIAPTDPRHVKLEGLPHLHEFFPPIVDCDVESEAVDAVRSMYPSAIAMHVSFTIGSGEVLLLGILADIGDAPPLDQDINTLTLPFVLLVQAVPQSSVDRRTVQCRQQFAYDLWRSQVQAPTDNVIAYDVEVRATDLATPVLTQAIVGEHDGRLTLRWSIGGNLFSISFRNANVVLEADFNSSRRRP